MKRWLLAALVLLLSFPLTGCTSRQLEEELLVIVLAVDKTPEGSVCLAVKAPRNAKGDTSSNSSGHPSDIMLEATGRGFSDAAALLNATTPRQLNFSQIREIVIGQAAAQNSDFGALLRQIDGLPRLRCSATVIICQGEARALISEQKPYVGLRLSRYAETTLSHYAGKGFTPITSLCEGVRDLGSGFRDPLFVYGALNDFSTSHPDQDNVLDAAPGSLPRKSGDRVELFGAAVTDGDHVSGFLTGYEMGLVHLLQGNEKSLTIRQETDLPLSLQAAYPAALTVDLSARPAVLRVSLTCEVRYPPGHPPDEGALYDRLTDDLRALIVRLQSLRCDGLGFGAAAVRSFWSVQEWERLSWRAVYCNAQVEIFLKLRMREG